MILDFEAQHISIDLNMERIIKYSKWVLRMSSEHAQKDVYTRKALSSHP